MYRGVKVGSRESEREKSKKRWGIYASHMRDAEWGDIRIAAVPMGEKENGRKEDKGRAGNGQRGGEDGMRSRGREPGLPHGPSVKGTR